MSIIIKDLNFVYSKNSPYEKTALKNINLTIDEGDFLAIIGHTGSGKSTLINHLNALTRIQSGQILVNGMDLSSKKIDYKALRATVGMVFQYPEYQLFDVTVAKDVGFGPRNLKLEKDEIDFRVREAITLVGLDYESLKERSPFELSGGQRRRVALAGVLAMRPKILVLDEPTAGLDPRGKTEILKLIKKVQEQMCPTIIMISHNMDEVNRYASKIAVMAEGELKTVVKPSELFGKVELLKKYNILPPFLMRLTMLLNEKGLSVPLSLQGEDEVIAEIIKLKGDKANA